MINREEAQLKWDLERVVKRKDHCEEVKGLFVLTLVRHLVVVFGKQQA